jgi:predicted RNase H-like nuclease
MVTQDGPVVGLDGYRGGWIGCLWTGPDRPAAVVALASLADAETALPPNTAVLAIDIPLGLDEAARPGGRECDQLARQRIGARRSSVFSSPSRGALNANSHAEASQMNRGSGPLAPGLSLQAYALFPKLREADAALAGSAWLRERVIEVHPEVSFCEKAGRPLEHPKKTTALRRVLRMTPDFMAMGLSA